MGSGPLPSYKVAIYFSPHNLSSLRMTVVNGWTQAFPGMSLVFGLLHVLIALKSLFPPDIDFLPPIRSHDVISDYLQNKYFFCNPVQNICTIADP